MCEFTLAGFQALTKALYSSLQLARERKYNEDFMS